jgi:CheY-like chemotaxis protein
MGENRFSSSGSRRLAGLRVLFVDNDDDNRELFPLILDQYGAGVTAVATVGEALEALDRERPDALVSDIVMPGEDGLDLIRKVRTFDAGRGGEIVAVAVSGHSLEEDQRRALTAGYNAYFTKPVEYERLTKTIADLILQVSHTRALRHELRVKSEQQRALRASLETRRDELRADRERRAGVGPGPDLDAGSRE